MNVSIGLIVNPVAGLGGRLAQKGSDASNIRDLAKRAGIESLAPERAGQTVRRLLDGLESSRVAVRILAGADEMGADALDVGIPHETIASDAVHPGASSSEDTKSIARNMARRRCRPAALCRGRRHGPRHPRRRRNQHPGAGHPRRRQDLLRRLRPDTFGNRRVGCRVGWPTPTVAATNAKSSTSTKTNCAKALPLPASTGRCGSPRTLAGFSRASPAAPPPTSMPPARWAWRSQPPWSRTGTTCSARAAPPWPSAAHWIWN